ncbi:preprotein translocase subunit SecG [candidate division KSB1 bacterium]|nr:preprotein translocase subunit SecG [candidate division KSB1 bacterium]
MYSFLIVLFMLVCFALTFVILIQSSKGGGLAGTFGGMDTMGSLFGGRGSAPFLQKVTAVLAIAFLLISLLMGMMTRGSVSQESLVQQERERMESSPARTLPQVPQQPVPTQPVVPTEQ